MADLGPGPHRSSDIASLLGVKVTGLGPVRAKLIKKGMITKALGDGLFELRHVGKLNTRVLWFFVKNRRIVAVHGIRNKGQAIPARDLATARERMHEWQKRVQQ